MLRDVMGLSREGTQRRVWRGLLPAAGTPATLSPLPRVTRVLLGRVTPLESLTQMSLMCGFRSVLRAEVRAKSQHVPPVPQGLLPCPCRGRGCPQPEPRRLQGRRATSECS